MRHLPKQFGLPAVATFSIVAVDPQTGEIGVAVQSKFLAVGSVVPWVSSDAGAIATQSWANTSYGPKGLEMLRHGVHPQQVIDTLTSQDTNAKERQVGIVDMRGQSATYTGSGCFAYAGGITGTGYAAQGNILAGSAAVDGLVKGIESDGPLANRLLNALDLAQQAGGDKRGMQSAAMYIAKAEAGYGGFNDHFMDLRVDDHDTPIDELRRLVTLQRLYFGKTDPDDRVALAGDILTETRDQLLRLGYSPGAGATYDEATKAQLQTYFLTENFDDRWTDEPVIDRLVLDYMRAQKR